MAKNSKQENVFDVSSIIPATKKQEKKIQQVITTGNEIKDARLNLKIKQSVKDKLYELAKAEGLSATDYIEKIINKEYVTRNT